MTGSKVLAICHSDKDADRYALFYDDKRLRLWDSPERRADAAPARYYWRKPDNIIFFSLIR
jgi:hypothetical protein